jgi:hypothetical protein
LPLPFIVVVVDVDVDVPTDDDDDDEGCCEICTGGELRSIGDAAFWGDGNGKRRNISPSGDWGTVHTATLTDDEVANTNVVDVLDNNVLPTLINDGAPVAFDGGSVDIEIDGDVVVEEDDAGEKEKEEHEDNDEGDNGDIVGDVVAECDRDDGWVDRGDDAAERRPTIWGDRICSYFLLFLLWWPLRCLCRGIGVCWLLWLLLGLIFPLTVDVAESLVTLLLVA